MLIGNGAIYCTDGLAYMRGMADASVDLVCSDPPYKVVSGGNKSPIAEGYRNSVLEANDGKIFKYNDVKFEDYLPELYRILKPGSHCYLMTNRINLIKLITAAEHAGFVFHNILRWDKPNVNANRWYMIDCEYTIFLAKRPVKPINNMGSKQGFPARFDEHKFHPTQKPVSLMDHYVMNSTEPGQIVFDPFAGAGSTLIAAQRAGRVWLGCEIDPMWYNIATIRLCQE